MIKLKNIFLSALVLIWTALGAFAGESATSQFTVTVPEYLRIESVTSPVLIAHITDSTGNLKMPLMTEFKVISNSTEQRALYLQSQALTGSGYQNSMYEQGGIVYIAFGNLRKPPTATALSNCKRSASPIDSPGVVAYPIISIKGAKTKFIPSKGKYEVYVDSGRSNIKVVVGQNVNPNSFAKNDPKGYYQAILSLTEADI